MKVGTVIKKVDQIKVLIKVHSMIKATLRYMNRNGIVPQSPRSEVLKHKESLENILKNIEEEFDELLK